MFLRGSHVNRQSTREVGPPCLLHSTPLHSTPFPLSPLLFTFRLSLPFPPGGLCITFVPTLGKSLPSSPTFCPLRPLRASHRTSPSQIQDQTSPVHLRQHQHLTPTSQSPKVYSNHNTHLRRSHCHSDSDTAQL